MEERGRHDNLRPCSPPLIGVSALGGKRTLMLNSYVRMQRPSTKPLCAGIIALCIWGCRSGERPFLQVQFCLTDTTGPADLKRAIQDIARDEGMKFTDRSAEAEAELRAIETQNPEIERSFPLIMVSARRGDVGLGVSNAGLGTHQVVAGFSRNNAEARAFANRAVERLEQQWKLVRVPNDRGAFPLKNCPNP